MRILFILVVMISGSLTVTAQTDSLSVQLRSISLTNSSIISTLNLNKHNKTALPFSPLGFQQNIPQYKTTAFFCLLEDKILRTSKVPIRMRLGSLDYTNSMEGKNPFDIELSNSLATPQ